MGHVHDEPVLVLKACIGNRSLGWDLLPPGSERFEFEGKIYAGYKDSPLSWDKGTSRSRSTGTPASSTTTTSGNAKKVLKNLAKYYPDYKGQGYEVAGFVWWQGHKDQNPAHASRYEQNLVHLIKTLRKDFDAPDAKFVLATIAFGGEKLAGHGLTVANAQLAVSGETGQVPGVQGQREDDRRPAVSGGTRRLPERRGLSLQPQCRDLHGSRQRPRLGHGGVVGKGKMTCNATSQFRAAKSSLKK